jgi:hypothetical protein
MSNQKVIVGVEEFNSVTNYLMSKPYKEVEALLNELRQSAQIVELPEQEEPQQPEPENSGE